MENAVCRRCWDRVQIPTMASENDDGYCGGIWRVWLDRVGEKDGDSPDAGTGEGPAAGEDTNTTSTGAGDRSNRPEVQPGPPVRIPGRSHYAGSPSQPQPNKKQKGYRGAIDHSCSPGPRVARPPPLLPDPVVCLLLCPRGLWYSGVCKFSKTAKSSGWPLTEDDCCACRLVEVDSTPPPKVWRFSPLLVALAKFSAIPSPADPDGPHDQR